MARPDSSLQHRPRRRRLLAAMVSAAAVVAVLTVTSAAEAAAAPAVPDPAVTAAPGVTVKPNAAKLPAGPRKVAGLAKGPAVKLSPQAAGKAPRMVGSADLANAGCTPYITRTLSKTELNVLIDYTVEVLCNFYLSGSAQVTLIERTPGAPNNGQVVAAAPAFSFFNNYYGYSRGFATIDGRVFDGGAQVEIGLDVTLQTIYGGVWTGCFELPSGVRYLSYCSGLNTSTVSVGLGSGEISTGLPPDRLSVLRSLTEVSAASYSRWNIWRHIPNTYAEYYFDRSTDLCTAAPANPLGFRFESACVRHDFGYRNYKAAQRFPENKDRIDAAFDFDLTQVCDTYPTEVQDACYALASAYYEAVRIFGFQNVTPEQINDAAELLPDSARGRAPRL
jgi:hypothetical protein